MNEPVTAVPHLQEPIFTQIGTQLAGLVRPTSNQAAMLEDIARRRGGALERAVDRYVRLSQSLIELINAPPGVEPSGEIRTALRTSTNAHHSATAAAVAVAAEALSVLTEEQRRRLAGFRPLTVPGPEILDIEQTLLPLLEDIAERTTRGGRPSIGMLGDITGLLEQLTTLFGPGPDLGPAVRSLIVNIVRFWDVHPCLHPAGIPGPADMARLVRVVTTTPDPQADWCSALTIIFDSPVLPAGAADDRFRTTVAGLMLLTRDVLRPTGRSIRTLENSLTRRTP